MGEDPEVSIVIPAYNESGAIAATVEAIRSLHLPSYELIVVDDGSSDTTARAASNAGARVLAHPYNMGNGAAVKTGIRAAKGAVIVFLDGDGQHDPKDIPKLLRFLDRYHMVVGARQRDSETSLHRDLANLVYNKLASYVADFPIKDLTSGFRAMRRIDALRFVDMLPNRFSYPSTSTLAFIRTGRALKYVPITTKRRIGTSKIRILTDGPRFLLIIMKITMSYSPLRVFMPVSLGMFLLGASWYAYTYIADERFTNMSALLFNTSIILFMLGLIAEQIASLRFERGDRVHIAEDATRYSAIRHNAEAVLEE